MILRAARKALNHFGPWAQFYDYNSKLSEELEELKKAVNDCNTNSPREDFEAVEDEIADVILMVIQVVMYLKLSPWRIYQRLKFKAKRISERIDNHHYSYTPHQKATTCATFHPCYDCKHTNVDQKNMPCSDCHKDKNCYWEKR